MHCVLSIRIGFVLSQEARLLPGTSVSHHGDSPVAEGTHQQDSANEAGLDVRNVPGQIAEMAGERAMEEKVPVSSLERTVSCCQQHRGRISEERRGGKRSWVTEVADEGQGARQEETTCDGGVVGMRRGWWGDESKDVGRGRAETILFVTHLAGRKGHRLIS